MFTGIIEEVGQVKLIDSNSLTISCTNILEDIKLGDSIAVDGVCLTVTSYNKNSFTADVSPETFNVTKLDELKYNELVNLERAMGINSRFGGHIVTGHIDTVGKINKIIPNGNFYQLEIFIQNTTFYKYLVKKGSITIDGISLTISELSNSNVNIAVIPHTFESTNLKTLKKDSNVNIEFDILAKYVEKNLLMNDNKSNITVNFLEDNGFV